MNLVMLGDFSGRNVGHNVLLRTLPHQLGRLDPAPIVVTTPRPPRRILRAAPRRTGR